MRNLFSRLRRTWKKESQHPQTTYYLSINQFILNFAFIFHACWCLKSLQIEFLFNFAQI